MPFAVSKTSNFDEETARRVLMVQAFETATAAGSTWTADDRSWATRVARESVAAGATPAQALAERCRHALHRLLPRDAAAARALAWRAWHPAWVPLAALLGLLAGLAMDAIGSEQRVNLLAPPVWGVLLWNLAVYAFLLAQNSLGMVRGSSQPNGLGGRRGLGSLRGPRGWLARRTAGAGVAGLKTGTDATANPSAHPLARYAATWAEHGAPLGAARAALVLHCAAAALAAGLMLGLYARGLVLDYRAGWQSTFLEAEQVQTGLRLGLAPAVAFTGIGVPDTAAVQALRVQPGQPASASAAPWIYLYAAMLLLFVLLPRAGLAALAAGRAWHLSRHLSLPLHEPYFQRLLQGMQQGSQAVVQVLPQGAAPSPQATLGLQAWLRTALGDTTVLHIANATVYGEEERAATLAPPAGATLRIVLVDLGATPEADTHGRFVQALRNTTPALPLLLLADEATLLQRYAQLPERLAQRRQAWRDFSREHGAAWAGVDLQQPDLTLAEATLSAALAAA